MKKFYDITFRQSLSLSALILVLGIIVIFQIQSCTTIQGKPSVCDNAPADSLICKYIPDPEGADLILCLANDEMLWQKLYTREEALNWLGEIEYFVSNVDTYDDMARGITSRIGELNSRIGTKLIRLAGYFCNFLGEKLPVSEFDRGLILKHLERQKQIVAAFGG